MLRRSRIRSVAAGPEVLLVGDDGGLMGAIADQVELEPSSPGMRILLFDGMGD